MTLFFIEARSGCDCCQHLSHFRGPYKTKEEAERRAIRLAMDGLGDFHELGKYWVVQHFVERKIEFGHKMPVWIIKGMWFYESDNIPVRNDGSIPYSEYVEKFCGIDEL